MEVEVAVTAGPMKGKSFRFDEPDRFLFGRAENARCSLPDDPYVSRYHFLLEIAPPQVSLHDLGSKNGTVLNGVRHGGTRPPGPGVKQAPPGQRDVALKDGDELVVGETHLRIAVRSGEPVGRRAAETLSLAPAPAGEPPAPLEEVLEAAAGEREAAGEPVLPGYEVLGVLGEGGMGKVFKARERRTGRLVAIKTILPLVAASKEAVATFKRETDLTRQLRHPRIVEFIEGGSAKGTFFLVLEFVDGMDLGTLLERRGGRMAIGEAGPIVLEALEGLAYAHAASVEAEVVAADGRGHAVQRFRGVVHRDLKPANILLEHLPGGRFGAKVADLGLAKVFGSAGLTDMTRPDAMCGTPYYWPLEQITEYRYLKPSADVFSMGAVLFEILTGRLVRSGFEKIVPGSGFHALCAVIVTEAAVPIATYAPDLPRPIADVIDRSLAERPEDRYADAGAMRDALRAALERSGVAAT